MKFFKQTKETKRKISFFMALAMVISLLPASPVVKAGSTNTASNDSKIYVNVETEAGKYVEYVETVTGGATKENEATTASVIVVPKDNSVTFTDVKAEVEQNVTSAKAVTLGSIAIKKGEVTTSASVVVRKKNGGSGDATAVSPSNLDEGVIAKASLVATGQSITGDSKNISGAVISIDGIAADNDIEVAIVLDNGEEVTNPSEDKTATVTFDDKKMTDATFKVEQDGKVIASSDNKTAKVLKSSIIYLSIIPGKDKEFKELPTIIGAGVTIIKEGYKTGGVYEFTLQLGVAEQAKVSINAAATDIVPSVKEYTVDYSSTILNADIEVTLSGKNFETGSKVKAADTLDIIISPKSGYYFDSANLPNVTLAGKTATLDVTGVAGNDYKASVSQFTADTKIKISGIVKKADVVNETKPEDNVGAATLDTESIQVIKTDLTGAFENNSGITAASKAAVEAALKDKGTVGVSLSVTTAGINKADEEKGKNAIDSKDEDAKKRAVALNISLTAICKDKDGKEVARVEVNELTKEVKISIKATGIFGEKFSETPDVNCTRNYFVINVHDGKTEKIECKLVKGNIEFTSKQFSTYVFSYEDVKTSATPTPTSGKNPPSVFGGGGGASTPTPTPSASGTPAPSASATPGVSATPVPSATVAPSGSPSDTATPAPSGSSKPDATKAPNDNNNNAVKIKVGKKVTVNSSKYKVTSVSGTRAVQFTSGKKNVKNIVIPATVKISGKNYKVTSIAKNAFKNNKKLKKVTIGANVNKIGKAAFKGCKNLKSIVIKTKKLTAKKVGANAFKGINKKATFKVPKNKVKAYKKIVKAKGAAKTVKVKK